MRYIVESGWRFESWYVYDKHKSTYVYGPCSSEAQASCKCSELNGGYIGNLCM